MNVFKNFDGLVHSIRVWSNPSVGAAFIAEMYDLNTMRTISFSYIRYLAFDAILTFDAIKSNNAGKVDLFPYIDPLDARIVTVEEDILGEIVEKNYTFGQFAKTIEMPVLVAKTAIGGRESDYGPCNANYRWNGQVCQDGQESIEFYKENPDNMMVTNLL